MNTVSVIIPTYNRAEWLAPCIESLRRSGVRDMEIVVVDDGSTDNTSEVVAQLGGDIQYVYQQNAGCAAARNTGVKHCRGSYLAFLDSDDQWLPDGHAHLLRFLEAHPDVAVGFADVRIGNTRTGFHGLIDASGREALYAVPNRREAECFRILEQRPFFRRLASQRQPVCIDSVIIRRDAFERVGGFDASLALAEDWELWLRVAARYTFVFYDRALALYEKHAGEISNDEQGMRDAMVDVLRRVLAKDLGLGRSERAFVRRRLSEQMFGWVYNAFDRGDHAMTRDRCATWVATCGPTPGVVFYWGCSWLKPADVPRLRAIKERLVKACAARLASHLGVRYRN